MSQGKTVKEIAVLHGVKQETIRTHRRNWRHHKTEAILSTGHFVTACLQESVTGEYFYAYVMGVAKQIKEKYNIPLTFIVDNASIHKSKKMQAWRDLLEQDFNLTLYFLPPYSPELNRIEMLWRSMKYQSREFKWMPTDEIVQWVNGISRGFGNKYLFTF